MRQLLLFFSLDDVVLLLSRELASLQRLPPHTNAIDKVEAGFLRASLFITLARVTAFEDGSALNVLARCLIN